MHFQSCWSRVKSTIKIQSAEVWWHLAGPSSGRVWPNDACLTPDCRWLRGAETFILKAGTCTLVCTCAQNIHAHWDTYLLQTDPCASIEKAALSISSGIDKEYCSCHSNKQTWVSTWSFLLKKTHPFKHTHVKGLVFTDKDSTLRSCLSMVLFLPTAVF